MSLLNDEPIFRDDHIFVISKQWHCGGWNHAIQFQVQSRAKEGLNKVEITSMRENAFLAKSYLKLGLECCPSRKYRQHGGLREMARREFLDTIVSKRFLFSPNILVETVQESSKYHLSSTFLFTCLFPSVNLTGCIHLIGMFFYSLCTIQKAPVPCNKFMSRAFYRLF